MHFFQADSEKKKYQNLGQYILTYIEENMPFLFILQISISLVLPFLLPTH